MKFLKGLFPGLLSLSLLIGYGCASDDDGSGNMVPDPLDNPPSNIADLSGNPDGNINPAGIGGWGSGDPSLVDKDGWIKHPEIPLPIIYFAFDKSDIGTSERPKLDETAAFLQGKGSEYCLIIEGNCDERGSEEYNRALGERRAIAIKDYLQAKGISADRMKTISYGEDKPAVEGHTPEAWAKNRRGDLVAATRPKQ